MRTHLRNGLLTGLVAAAAMAGAACTAPPAAQIPAGCYDSVDTFADFSYSGVPNVAGNMDFWSSTDGSCTDTTGADVSNSTLVVAADTSAATELCRSIGLGETLGRWTEFGYAGLPDDAWLCSNMITRH